MTLPPLFGPNFPSYEKEYYDNDVDVLWYHPSFSQSRYPPGQEGSEACTLICLLIAARIRQMEIEIWSIDEFRQFEIIMAEAIIEGNATHAWIMSEEIVPYAYLNVEEALRYGGWNLRSLKEWAFYVYHENIGESLFQNIETYLRSWYKHPKGDDLFMLLITSGRTLLFIFQEKTCKVTLFDSHSHTADERPTRGLVVAQVLLFFPLVDVYDTLKS